MGMSKKDTGAIKQTSKAGKIGIYVVLIILAITIIVPIAWVFMASLKENEQFYGSPWTLPNGLHFENFVQAWQEADMGSYMLNSVIVTALGIGLLIIISLPAAYVLARFKFKTSRFWNVLFMAGLFINVNYIVVPIFLMLVDADSFLQSTLGHGFFLNNLFILALIYASTALPFTIYLLSGYFKSLAKDYEEAAYVDGAGYFRTMIQVIFPMAKPSIITIILFNFLSFWNEYIISMTMLTKPTLKTLPVGLMNLMAAQKSAVQYGRMYAGLVLVMLPTLILYMCVQKQLTEGMTVGGLKG
jgi:N-acetylglucosamine transport system permease protein